MRSIRFKKVGMKRAKKKKVTVVEPLEKAAASVGIEEQPPPSPAKKSVKPVQPPSPGRSLRLQAGVELRAAAKLRKWAQKEQTSAEAKYRAEVAIHAAKCARLEKVKMTGSAVEKMKAADRVLQGVNDADRRLLVAAARFHEAQLDAAATLIAEQKALNSLLELQIARFKRVQRRRRKPQ